MSEKLNVATYEDYTLFVTRLASKHSMADFNTKLGTMGLGLAGEAGEIAALVLEVVCDESLDSIPKLVLEIGDAMWYVTFAADNVVQAPLSSFIPTKLEDPVPLVYDSPTKYLEMYNVRMMYVCGGVADQVKKLLYHGKPYTDDVRIKLEKGLCDIVMLICLIARDVCGVDLQYVIDKNVEKLSARYKTLQFTTEEFMEKEKAKE